MANHEDDLELLLSLQDHQDQDRVLETPPASPSSNPSPGYFSDDDIPKPGRSLGMAAFKDVVKDSLEDLPKINPSVSAQDRSNKNPNKGRRGIQYHISTTRQKYTSKRAELRGGNLGTAFRDPLKAQGIYMVKPLVESAKSNKPSIPMKIKSADDLRKALSNADKVTTKHQSQGIRFLTRVANAENMEPIVGVGKPDIQTRKIKQYEEYLKKRVHSTTTATGVAGKQEPDVKRKKIQKHDDLIELDLDG